MAITVTWTEQFVHDADRRMPFHFGNVAATEGPHLIARVQVEIDGDEQSGVSMGGMTPTWFLKDPDVPLADATADLLDVVASAFEHAIELEPAPSVFDLWHDLHERQRKWAADTHHPPLLWAYGVSLVEQAVIDAFCRHRDLTFGAAVRENAFGIEPGRIYPELAGVAPATYLPEKPTRRVAVRHTIGLTDPLETDDVDATNRLTDGLPQTLEEYVTRQGVDHFKIKLSADRDRDATRLARIGDVLAEQDLDSYVCTLDANEQYESARAFKKQWERHAGDPALSDVTDHVRYVEQPLPRESALTEETRTVLRKWDDRPPIVIDESDDHLDSAGRAIECGYAGTSHKNCKGVFKGVVNACLVEHRRRENPGGGYRISCEDLTTIGPVELLQDLAVVGTLGAAHVERNGHHFYRGLSSLPRDVQESIVEAHGDLYRWHEDGFATLDVRNGRIDLGSVIDAPFGRDFALDPGRFTPIDEWSVDSVSE